jgi:hypothetical protein
MICLHFYRDGLGLEFGIRDEGLAVEFPQEDFFLVSNLSKHSYIAEQHLILRHSLSALILPSLTDRLTKQI